MIGKIHHIKNGRVISIASISSIVVGILLIVLGMTYYKYQISELGITDTTQYQEYKYHYALISEEEDAEFWEAIYQGALDKGKEEDAYVERLGKNLSVNYSLEDLMKIAIASKVDGIILEPNGEETINELVNVADEAGIPVVTVLKDTYQSNSSSQYHNDVNPSKRISFVDINSYSQGQAYGKQVAEITDAGKSNVVVLMNDDEKDSSQNVIYTSILEMIDTRKVTVKAVKINTQSAFSSEEDIRNIIMSKDNPPEVLVCLTSKDTLSAYQAVVDYNKVGQIDIIGYYDSDYILKAIEKNIVHSTMTTDANLMGAYCVEALTEYRKTNKVNDYYSVGIIVINKDNVDQYIQDNTMEEVDDK
ncbi:MAG: ABC-type sugar transport system periplasmic component-like protein [Firmicutes bacterium]|nr:ABC-type sugar transport system periplasmic component-like protein [Bacillota bacterium]